jgi:hypothetical protein
VSSGNHSAQALHRVYGFEGDALDPAKGHALFLEKDLRDRGPDAD